MQPQTYIPTRIYECIDSKAGTYLLFYINQLPYMTVIVVVVVVYIIYIYSSRRYTPAIRCILAAALLLPIPKPHTSCIYLPRSSSSAAAVAAIYTAPAQRIVLSVSRRPSASARGVIAAR